MTGSDLVLLARTAAHPQPGQIGRRSGLEHGQDDVVTAARHAGQGGVVSFACAPAMSLIGIRYLTRQGYRNQNA